MGRLETKVSLIAGSSGSMGRAAALFAREGASVRTMTGSHLSWNGNLVFWKRSAASF